MGLGDRLEAKRKQNRDKLGARAQALMEAEETVREVLRVRVGNPTDENKQGPLVSALRSGGYAVIAVTDRHVYVFKSKALTGIDDVVLKTPLADVSQETLDPGHTRSVFIGGRFFLPDDPGSKKRRIGELREAIEAAQSGAPHNA
jgi:hypothetical protein